MVLIASDLSSKKCGGVMGRGGVEREYKATGACSSLTRPEQTWAPNKNIQTSPDIYFFTAAHERLLLTLPLLRLTAAKKYTLHYS